MLGEYFGTKATSDQIDATCSSADALLFTPDGQKKSVMLTLEAAQAQREKLHFVALNGVSASGMSSYFLPFINFAKAPDAPHYISAKVVEETETYYLPCNLWAIINLADGERVASLPESLLEVSSVSDITVSACDKSEAHTAQESISYSQMKILIDQAKCNVEENEWKKFDIFTNFLEKGLSFTISNKQWIGMEKYIAVLNACDKKGTEALDEAISAKIVPSILAKALEAEEKIDITAGMMTAFQDNEMPLSRKAIRELNKFELRA